jgi:site-specific DNA-methyltransferase (adenine-specific)
VDKLGPFKLNRCHCGDALKMLWQLPDESVDFIFTDPPYGHNNNNGDLINNRENALGKKISHGSQSHARPIANDGDEASELVKVLFAEAKRILKPGSCCCCCCGGGGPDPQFARWSLWMDEFLGFKMCVVWDKGPMGMGWHYRRSWECVLVGQKPGKKTKWFDETNAIENIIRPGQYGIKKIIPRSDQHPTEKPKELAAHFIKLHALPGEIVLDPFSGHGTTGEAAIMLGRNFLGFEIDKGFSEVANTRINASYKSQTVEQYEAGQMTIFDAMEEK